jgi:hypothetical protein
MSEKASLPTEPSPAPDVVLLLRAHAEQLWLSREVISVLRQLEARESSLPEEQSGAALAYLEVVWTEALKRAQETDAAHVQLDLAGDEGPHGELVARARRYHASVRNLREAVARRVQRLLAAAPDVSTPGDPGPVKPQSARTRSARGSR